MIDSVSGVIGAKTSHRVIVEVGGVGLGLFVSERTSRALPAVGAHVKLFSFLHVRENALELYGFLSHEELALFVLLISVSGVGPKSALSLLEVSEIENLTSAIKEGKADLLTKASGIGRKIAERIVIELRGKVESHGSAERVSQMESDIDIVETLTNLGYRKEEIRNALLKSKETTLEGRLREALKILGPRKK